jgi:Fe-S-cluster-containing dehydrogenase component
VSEGRRFYQMPQTAVEREVRPTPDRYRNPIGRYKVRRSADCRSCAVCVEVCPYGVHLKPAGYALPLRPRDHLCIGPSCAATDHYCVEHCPNKALSVGRNPTADAIGDPRWTSDLLISTWQQAETGRTPANGLEYSAARRAAASTPCASAFRRNRRSASIRLRSIHVLT